MPHPLCEKHLEYEILMVTFTYEATGPFNPTTTIKCQIPTTNFVTLKVYDVLGQEVSTLVNEEMTRGSYEFTFGATGLPSGVYFYRMASAGATATKAMILMK
jgi:hypothetical protein